MIPVSCPIGGDLVIADASVSDVNQLLSNVIPGTDVLCVDAGSDPLALMDMAIGNGYSRIHLLGHGSPGAICLGGKTLGVSEFATMFAGSRDTLASLHFWSCRTGAGEAGRRFVDGLAKLFGSAVTAFSGLVGSKALGGSWMPDVFSSHEFPVTQPFTDTTAFAGTLADAPPELVGSFNYSNKLILNFSESIFGVDKNDFEVSIAGAEASVISVSINGNRLILTLDSESVPGELVTVSYDGVSMQDASGNETTAFSAASFVLSSEYSGTLFDKDLNGSFDFMQVVETYTDESGLLQREGDMYRIGAGEISGTTTDFIAHKVISFEFGSVDPSGRPISFFDDDNEIAITWAADPIHGAVATAPLTFYTHDPADPEGDDIENHGTIYFYDSDSDNEFDSMEVWAGQSETQLFVRFDVIGYTYSGGYPTSMTTVFVQSEDSGSDIFDFTLDYDSGTISLPPDEFESDNEQPWFQEMTASGNTLTLHYNELVDFAHLPSADAFTVSVNGSGAVVTGVTASENKVFLTIDRTVVDGDTLAFTYSDPNSGLNDSYAIQDITGNDASSLNVGSGGGETDLTPPSLTVAFINSQVLTLMYNETLDSGHLPVANDFRVYADGIGVGIASVGVSGSSVILNLATSVQADQTVTVFYTDPTTGNDTSAIQDISGNDAMSHSVTAQNGSGSEPSVFNVYGENMSNPYNHSSVFRAGEQLVTYVEMSEDVMVTGTPHLALLIGEDYDSSHQVSATYEASLSTATSLAFTYELQQGDTDGQFAIDSFDFTDGSSITGTFGSVEESIMRDLEPDAWVYGASVANGTSGNDVVAVSIQDSWDVSALQSALSGISDGGGDRDVLELNFAASAASAEMSGSLSSDRIVGTFDGHEVVIAKIGEAVNFYAVENGVEQFVKTLYSGTNGGFERLVINLVDGQSGVVRDSSGDIRLSTGVFDGMFVGGKHYYGSEFSDEIIVQEDNGVSWRYVETGSGNDTVIGSSGGDT